jgi:hypothetical protein
MISEDEAGIGDSMFGESTAPVFMLLYVRVFAGRESNDAKEEYGNATHYVVMSMDDGLW